jgi:hypothetical protein
MQRCIYNINIIVYSGEKMRINDGEKKKMIGQNMKQNIKLNQKLQKRILKKLCLKKKNRENNKPTLP